MQPSPTGIRHISVGSPTVTMSQTCFKFAYQPGSYGEKWPEALGTHALVVATGNLSLLKEQQLVDCDSIESATVHGDAVACSHPSTCLCVGSVAASPKAGYMSWAQCRLQVSSRFGEPPMHMNVADFKVSCCLGDERLEDE